MSQDAPTQREVNDLYQTWQTRDQLRATAYNEARQHFETLRAADPNAAPDAKCKD